MVLNEGTLRDVPPEELGLSTSLLDLPLSCPYGFWVDRHGNYMKVGVFEHDEGVYRIIKNAKKYFDARDEMYQLPTSYQTLFEQGYARIVNSGSTVIYQLQRGGELSNGQKKFLNALKEKYKKRDIERDNR